VIALAGDGDTGAIGGNHFLHAARRNIDVTLIISNNFIYGRTGGQYGPTSPAGSFTTTAPHGLVEPTVDFCKLAEAAGATFVARGTTYHTTQLVDLIAKGIVHKGFSVVDVISQCPESFGRLNPKRMGRTGAQMMKWMRENAILSSGQESYGRRAVNKIMIGSRRKGGSRICLEYQKLVRKSRGDGINYD